MKLNSWTAKKLKNSSTGKIYLKKLFTFILYVNPSHISTLCFHFFPVSYYLEPT